MVSREKIKARPAVNRTRLLNRVVSFYHTSFCEDSGAMEYLKSKGITNNGGVRLGIMVLMELLLKNMFPFSKLSLFF